MNELEASFVSLEEEDCLGLVTVRVADSNFYILMLEAKALLEGSDKLKLLFNENELLISKNEVSSSAENIFKAKISDIKKGKILWQVFLSFNKHSLSAVVSAKQGILLDLKKDMQVSCHLKASDIMLKVV